MMGDINGLKFLNDAFGHAEGINYWLKQQKLFKTAVIKCNYFTYRGDEFTILFPNTTSEEAYEVLKHIQHCCNDYNSYTFNEAYPSIFL